MLEPNSKALAPLASVLFVTIYSKITILPSSNFLPITPSPKYTSNLPLSVSCKKYIFDSSLIPLKPVAKE